MQSSNKATYDEIHTKAWYRVLQIARLITLGIILFIGYSASKGSAGYIDYVTGASYPSIPFHWGSFFQVVVMGAIIVELIRAIAIYAISGRSFWDSMNDLIEGR